MTSPSTERVSLSDRTSYLCNICRLPVTFGEHKLALLSRYDRQFILKYIDTNPAPADFEIALQRVQEYTHVCRRCRLMQYEQWIDENNLSHNNYINTVSSFHEVSLQLEVIANTVFR